MLAGLLFGGLTAGGTIMQSRTGTSIELVTVLQSVIVVFIAAPAMVSAVFRTRGTGEGIGTSIATGWNG